MTENEVFGAINIFSDEANVGSMTGRCRARDIIAGLFFRCLAQRDSLKGLRDSGTARRPLRSVLSSNIVTRILNHIIRTKGLFAGHFFQLCATLLHLPGQIVQRQEPFSYRDTCMRPVGRDFLMRDTFKRLQLVVKRSW